MSCYERCDGQMQNRKNKCMTYVRPGNEVVGSLVKGLDDGVSDNLFWQVEAHGVFDEVEDGLAAASVAANVDV